MTERIVPRRPYALSDGIEAGGPHMAATDLELAKGTQALVRRSAGNRYSLSYHSPRVDSASTSGTYTQAPYAELTDATTWTDFALEVTGAFTADVQVPWYVSEAHDYPVVVARCVSDARYLSLELRVQATTFVQAISPQEFYSDKSYMPFFGVSMSEWSVGEWDKGAPSWFEPRIECKGISLPSAPRDVLLTPQIRISQRGSSLADVAGTYRVYLSQLNIYDAWDE